MINQTWPIFDDDDSGAVSVTARSRRGGVGLVRLGRIIEDLTFPRALLQGLTKKTADETGIFES